MDNGELIVFEDLFDIKDIDDSNEAGGKKMFDRVSRLKARSENYEMDLTLDYNDELYPLEIGEKFSLVLAASLSSPNGKDDLSDEYEYVMSGKVYRYEDSQKQGSSSLKRVSVYVSFGGLLMCLEGDYKHLQNITVGENIYLLMRK